MAGDDIRRDWSLKLEGFGRIVQAAVEVKPFTVLVGANNTGKSYLASLIWGIEGGGWRKHEAGTAELSAVFERWHQRSVQAGRQPAEISTDEMAGVVRWWDEVTPRFIEALCARLFDEPGIAPERIRISPPGHRRRWSLHADAVNSAWLSAPDAQAYQIIWSFDEADPDPEQEPEIDFLADAYTLHMADLGARQVVGHAYSAGDPVFLPASRTGFSLFMHAVVQDRVSSALRHRSPDQVARSEATRFTLPQIHLLNALLVAFGGKPGPFADEADRLEAELEGRLSVEAVPGATHYRFTPAGSERPLGLQLSSALVTELMPLVITLRYARELPFLVLEEPEAHLHPGVQRAVIRCLGRLVRRGVRVLITTHSTTVAQQINNLVKLGALSPEERAGFAEFGYGPDDHLAVDEVAVHHFALDGAGRSVVAPVEAGPGGFPMPTFNDLLGRMAEETSRLYAALDRGDEG